MTTENVDPVQTTESETTTASVLTTDPVPEQTEIESVLTSAAEVEEPKSVVPENYELSVPEGAAFEQAHIDEIAAYARKQGLSNEQAQALVDRDGARVQAAEAEHKQLVQEHYTKVLAEAKSDPEIGGDKWGETVQKAQRFLNALGDNELKQIFHDNPDISNNKAVLRFMRRGFERFMGDDSLVTGNNAPPPREKMTHEVLYGADKEP